MSWEMVKLGDVCNVKDGTHDSPKYVNDGFPLVTSKNLKDGFVDLTDVNLISEDDFYQINKRSKVDKGDILMPMIGTIGNPVTVDEEPIFAIKNVCLIKPLPKVQIQYLFYVLKSKFFQQTILGKSRGGTQKFISLGDIRSFPFPLPPLSTQKRIAEILDKADALRKKDQQLLKHYDQLAQSLFIDLFGDPVKNEKGWEVKNLEQVVIFKGGGTPNTSKDEYYNGEIPWVSPKDMKVTFINNSIDKINELAIKESSTKLIEVNSVLMVVRSGILKHTLPLAINTIPLAINQDMKALQPKKELNPIYLMFAISSQSSSILKTIRGTTADNISSDVIKKIRINLPPIEIQNQFATQIQNIEQQKERLKLQIQASEHLFQSLLKQAFNGGLN